MYTYSNWRSVHVFFDDVGNVYPTKVHRVWHGLHPMAKIPYFHKTILLSILFWPLHCLSFLDLRLLITPLVSSFFSWKLNTITPAITLTFTSYCYQRSHIKKCKILYSNKLWKKQKNITLSEQLMHTTNGNGDKSVN